MQTHMARACFETVMGPCAISWTDAGLTAFELPGAQRNSDDETIWPVEISRTIERVRKHLQGELQDFSDARFDFSGLAEFNANVLAATLAIKAGQTRSYGEIAQAIGQPPAASRAVGAALGANRWPLLIPCHRVVSADGKMTGFSGPGGIKTKLRLLALEGAQLFAE